MKVLSIAFSICLLLAAGQVCSAQTQNQSRPMTVKPSFTPAKVPMCANLSIAPSNVAANANSVLASVSADLILGNTGSRTVHFSPDGPAAQLQFYAYYLNPVNQQREFIGNDAMTNLPGELKPGESRTLHISFPQKGAAYNGAKVVLVVRYVPSSLDTCEGTYKEFEGFSH